MRIFYVTNGEHIAGGQLINLEHVASLRRMGYDARFLIVRPESEPESAFTPTFPPGLELPWQRSTADLTGDDYVIIGEMFGVAAMQLIGSPARKLIHHQNPFYSFMAFRDLQSVKRWGCEAIIFGSRFGEDMLKRFGWDGPSAAVRVFVDPVFAQDPMRPRKLQVAYMPRKRGLEARLIRGVFLSRHPDLEDIPWQPVANLTRAQAAELVKESEVLLSLSEREGLGLPPLEAMLAGTLVVGFHGDGGLEYATPENGDWFGEGAHVEIADTLAERLRALKAGERFEARRRAGAETAASFSRERFEAELRAAWEMVFALG